MWSTGEGNGKPLQYSWLENPMKSMKRQKDRTLKDELPRSVGAQYATVSPQGRRESMEHTKKSNLKESDAIEHTHTYLKSHNI